MYYVYRYLDNKKIIYIGITNNLVRRYKQHKKDSLWFNTELTYQYIELDNKYIAKNFETYLINRDSPVGNDQENNKYDISQISFNIIEDWIEFKINQNSLKVTGKTKACKNSSSFKKFHRDDTLYLANGIAKQHFDFDLYTNKLFYMILYKLQQQYRQYLVTSKSSTDEYNRLIEFINKNDSLECLISNSDIKMFIKNNQSKSKASVLQLFSYIKDMECTFNSKSSPKSLINDVIYQDGYYKVSVDAHLYIKLFNFIDGGYTPIPINDLLSFRSKYSCSLYIALKMWSGIKKTVTIPIGDLRDILCLKEYEYAEQKTLGLAIKKIVADINKYSSLTILDVKGNRVSRKFVSLSFDLDDNSSRY